MDCLEAIFTRRSIRKFTTEPVSEKALEILLGAAMSSPTARNRQTWRFLVVNDRKILDEIPSIHQYAGMTREAPLAIIVCGDSSDSDVVFWPQDAAAAIQTMMLAARALDLGSVWCGIYPRQDRVDAFRSKFALPDAIQPLGMVVIGHPAQPFTREDRYDPAKIKYNHWS